MNGTSYLAWMAAMTPDDTADLNEQSAPVRTVSNAVWKVWPHVGECYRVRSRGRQSAFSREGFVWTDSFGKATDRPSSTIRFHGGPNNGKHITL